MIQVNSIQEISSDTTQEASCSPTPRPGTSRSPNQPSTAVIGVSLLSAVRPMVSASATNAETSAAMSDSLVRTKPAGQCRCSHIWLSASRRLFIQPSPAHTAGQTDHADGAAGGDRRIHQLDQLSAEVAGDRRPDPVLDLVHQLGPAGQQETTGGEADHQQWEQREDGEVGDARGVEVALGVVVTLLGQHRPSSQPKRARNRSSTPGLSDCAVAASAMVPLPGGQRVGARNPIRSYTRCTVAEATASARSAPLASTDCSSAGSASSSSTRALIG